MKTFLEQSRAEQSRAEQHKRTEEEEEEEKVLNRNFLSLVSWQLSVCVGVVLRPGHESDANAQIIPRWGNAK